MGAPGDALARTMAAEARGPATLDRGALVGRYVVLSKLGAGAMGVVYAAYDPELDRKVALKLVLPGSGNNGSEGRTRLLREAQALGKLSHPNVVAVFDVGTVGEQIWLAMEFVEGTTLTAWLKEKRAGRRFSWRTVVEVMQSAGQGLAAAHAAGLLHRDFKPDNVMVGRDGRVRVMDFGLACARPNVADLDLASAATVPVDSRAFAGLNALQIRLTQAGAIAGTPTYMAPEQFSGNDVTAAADQFAFCVTLWEAIFGERPFAGSTLMELAAHVLTGNRRLPPKGHGAPGWLRRACERGLLVEPGQRHPSMEALVAELRHDRAKIWRRWGVAAAIVAPLGGLMGTILLSNDGPHCDELAARLVDVWDAPRRAQVEAALTGTGLSYAAATWARVAPALDSYTDAWVSEAQARCLASDGGERVHNELAQLCLERQHAELKALVDVLASGDPKVVEHALEAVRQLDSPADCSDPASLATAATLTPPTDPVAVAALRQRLVVIKAEERAGRFMSVLEDSKACVEEARAIAYLPLLAEALLRRGSLLADSAAYAAADAALVDAYAAAEAAGNDVLRAEVLVLRLAVVGFSMAQPDAVAGLIPGAIALVRRSRPDSALEAQLWTTIGLVEHVERRYDLAEAHQRQALALLERVSPNDPERITVLLHLGRTLWARNNSRQGDGQALAVLEDARRLAETTLGPEHPSLVLIYLNLANASSFTDTNMMTLYYQKALEVGEKALGPDHPSMAAALSNLANVMLHDGKLDEALANYRRAVDIYLETLGEAHPTTAMNICNLASALIAAKRVPEAQEWYARALAIYGRTHDGSRPDQAMAIGGMGEAFAAEGRWEEARERAHQAFAVATAVPGPRPWHAYHWQLNEAEALQHLGRNAEALALGEELLAAMTYRFKAEDLGRLRLIVARALAETGAYTEAVSLAEAARTDLLTQTSLSWQSPLAEIDAWLAENRLGG